MSETAKYGTITILYTSLFNVGSRDAKVNPTLAAGDVQISKDGGNYANLATLPDLTPASLDNVRIQLAAAELQCKFAIIRFKDQTAPSDWDEQRVSVTTWGHPSAYDTSKNDVIRSSTAQAGAASSITLDASAVATDRYYNGQHIQILTGTGVGQVRRIVHYVGSSKIAYINVPWETNPDNTSIYLLTPFSQIIISFGSGLAQAGAATTITLGSHESATDYLFKGLALKICGGTGVGQVRTVVSYIGSSKVATVDRAWITNPDNTSLYEIISIDAIGCMGILHAGLMQAGSASTTAVLASTASAVNDYYDGHQVQIQAGTGVGQARIIASYVGSSKTATLTEAWATTPDATSVYIIRPIGDVEVGINNDKTGYSLAADQAVNVTKVDGVALATHASGMVPADARDILGTAISTPATAGILDVNVKNMNNVAATAITTINANIGQTQPLNFTGTGATAYVKSDMVDIAGAAVSTITAQIGTNVINSVSVSANTDKTGYTLSASEHTLIGSDAATAILLTPANKFDTDASGRANIGKVYSISAAAQRLSISAPTMITGTVTSAAFAPTTTQFEVSDITDAATDFYKSRTAIFTSGTLNHQARNITGYSLQGGKGRFTVDVLTAAPLHGDELIIV